MPKLYPRSALFHLYFACPLSCSCFADVPLLCRCFTAACVDSQSEQREALPCEEGASRGVGNRVFQVQGYPWCVQGKVCTVAVISNLLVKVTRAIAPNCPCPRLMRAACHINLALNFHGWPLNKAILGMTFVGAGPFFASL